MGIVSPCDACGNQLCEALTLNSLWLLLSTFHVTILCNTFLSYNESTPKGQLRWQESGVSPLGKVGTRSLIVASGSGRACSVLARPRSYLGGSQLDGLIRFPACESHKPLSYSSQLLVSAPCSWGPCPVPALTLEARCCFPHPTRCALMIPALPDKFMSLSVCHCFRLKPFYKQSRKTWHIGFVLFSPKYSPVD